MLKIKLGTVTKKEDKGRVSVMHYTPNDYIRLGFTYYDDKKSSYYNCFQKEDVENGVSYFINAGGFISIYSDKTIFALNTLYDLIKADLVEKIKED